MDERHGRILVKDYEAEGVPVAEDPQLPYVPVPEFDGLPASFHDGRLPQSTPSQSSEAVKSGFSPLSRSPNSDWYQSRTLSTFLSMASRIRSASSYQMSPSLAGIDDGSLEVEDVDAESPRVEADGAMDT